MKTNYFKDCKTLDEVKAMYKRLAMAHHPDRGGDTVIMQEINAEYEAIKSDAFFSFSDQPDETKQDFVEFPDIINQVIGFKGMIIELCGNWVWLSGSTYPYREELKKIGFLFAGEKKLWYWRPHDCKSFNRKPMSIDKIRRIYGSDILKVNYKMELEDRS
jgi:curved DNA-binding protein CbpA